MVNSWPVNIYCCPPALVLVRLNKKLKITLKKSLEPFKVINLLYFTLGILRPLIAPAKKDLFLTGALSAF